MTKKIIIKLPEECFKYRKHNMPMICQFYSKDLYACLLHLTKKKTPRKIKPEYFRQLKLKRPEFCKEIEVMIK